jgi:hypothetical protein
MIATLSWRIFGVNSLIFIKEGLSPSSQSTPLSPALHLPKRFSDRYAYIHDCSLFSEWSIYCADQYGVDLSPGWGYDLTSKITISMEEET